MKIKSAKKKSLQSKAKTGETGHSVVIVKTESVLEDDSCEGLVNGDALHVQIKEEPQSPEIGEECNGGLSSCSDATAGDMEVDVKQECDSDHQPECDFSEAAVKEESDSWIKEEGDSEGEAEARAELCTGTDQHRKASVTLSIQQ